MWITLIVLWFVGIYTLSVFLLGDNLGALVLTFILGAFIPWKFVERSEAATGDAIAYFLSRGSRHKTSL